MTKKRDILLIGLGTAGAQAAFYIFQRNKTPQLRIIAADTGEEEVSFSGILPLAHLPAAPTIPVGEAHREGREALNTLLENERKEAQLLVLITFFGGFTGVYYAQLALDYAKKNGLPAITLAAMPHAFDSEKCKVNALDTLGTFRSQHFEVITLDCQNFGALFPEAGPEEAYRQAVHWIAETTIGYLRVFLPEENPSAKEKSQTPIPAKMPRGIFKGTKPTFYNGENLDLPAYWRKNSLLPTTQTNADQSPLAGHESLENQDNLETQETQKND